MLWYTDTTHKFTIRSFLYFVLRNKIPKNVKKKYNDCILRDIVHEDLLCIIMSEKKNI